MIDFISAVICVAVLIVGTVLVYRHFGALLSSRFYPELAYRRLTEQKAAPERSS